MHKRKFIVFVYLLLIAIIITVPYTFSRFYYIGYLEGSAIVPAKANINIDDVQYLSDNNANLDQCQIISFDNMSVVSTISLAKGRNNYISYTVTITNYSTSAIRYNGFTFDGDNTKITAEVTGINENDMLNGNTSINVTLTFKNVNNGNNNSTLHSTVTFNFGNTLNNNNTNTDSTDNKDNPDADNTDNTEDPETDSINNMDNTDNINKINYFMN